jgi:hypothetical protein
MDNTINSLVSKAVGVPNQQVLNFLSSPNLSDADIYSFMQQNNVPASQIASVTGIPLADVVSRVSAVAPQNVLGGTILAGDSWLAGQDKTDLASQAFGQPVSNVAVGGFKTDDALNQLNTFVNNGGVFKTGSTVVLDIGGNDLLQGVDKNTIKSNIDQMLSIFDREGVKVVLSGAPAVGSVSDVTSSNNLQMDSLYKEVAQPYKNVTVVDAMSGLLNNKTLVDESGFHVNTAGQTDFLNQLASAADKKATPADVVAEITQPQKNLALTTENIDKLSKQILAQNTTGAWSGGLSPETSALYMASDLAKSGVTDISQVGKSQDGIINKVTGEKLVSGYGERTGGNLWSGSYEGSGNTGFGVDFNAAGQPVFYTQGASSSTLGKDIVKLAAITAAAYGLGGFDSLLGAGSTLGSLGTVGSDLAGLSGIPAGTGALTAAESAALYGTAGAAALPTAGAVGSDLAGLSGIPAGTGALTAAETAALYGTPIAGMGAGTGIAAGAAGLGLNAGTAGLNAGLTGGTLGATNSLLGGAALGSTLSSLGAGVGGSLLGSTIGNTLGNTVGSALGTTLGQGLGLSALGTGLGGLANQAGITDARNLINQYGTQAGTNLASAYRDAQGLNAANRTDLGNIYTNTTGNLYDLYNKQVGIQQPYQAIGQAGSQGLLANQDYLTHQFNANDLNSNLAPNYAFQLNQGQMANQRAGNMSGGALGGNAMQGLQRYTQDYAGNAYQNAFNNFNTQRQNIFGNLSNMANIGTTSAGQLANLGNTLGGNLGSLSSNYAGNLTTGTGQGINAANAYGLNTANLATGIGSALASNATQTGANNASMLSNLGNTALLGSMLKAT